MSDYTREAFERDRFATAGPVQPPATPQEPDEIADFWREVERSYDIEPRAFFEKEAKPMGYSSAVAMAVHHMWKRDVKDRDGQTIKVRASTPSPEGQTAWQPIETAPKDTAVLLWLGWGLEIGHFNTMLGRWAANWDHRALEVPATHWSPLPSPPPPEGTQP